MIKNFVDLTKLIYSFAPKYAFRLTMLKLVFVVTPIARLYVITKIVGQIEVFLGNSIDMNNIAMPILILILVEVLNSVASVYYQTEVKKTKLYIKSTKYPEFVEEVAKLEYKHYENSEIMDTVNRIKQNFNTRIVLSYSVSLYFLESIITALILIIIITTQIGIFGLVLALISVPLIVVGQKSAKDLYEADKKAEEHNRYLEYIESLFLERGTAVERNLFSSQNKLLEMWNTQYANTFRINRKAKRKVLRRAISSDILTFLAYALAIGVLFWALFKNHIGYGLFIALVISILRLMNTLSYTLAGSIVQMGKNKLFMDDYNRLISLSKENGAMDEPCHGIDFKSLEFKNVSFTYPNAKKSTLNGVSFIIERGKKYAFVGENGTGKTTIIKLLLRLYKPDKGDIIINGKPIAKYSYAQLKGLCSVVFQDYSKYPINIIDSLDLGMKNMDNSKKAFIMRYVGLDKFVDDNNQILNYELGKLNENSIEFSEGQWQRLSVARALLSDRNILILDEATSSIDPIREKEIYELFKKASENKTSIFITHRLGSTKFADIIYVIKNGRIVEVGNHENLMLKGKTYHEMYSSQSRWYQ